MSPAEQLVAIMNRVYSKRLTTTSGGNLSVKDDDGTVWITPSGIDKGALKVSDMCRVSPDGTVYGPYKPSVELPFHQSIYRDRPDIKAVLHAHSPALVAFSVARKIPNARLTQNSLKYCANTTIAEYAVPGSQTLGENISREFANGSDIVILENHGVVVGADTLLGAYMKFETAEHLAACEINARRIGAPAEPEQTADVPGLYGAPGNDNRTSRQSDAERNARREAANFVRRAYRQGLFTSTLGTVSYRFSDNSYVITPQDLDRGALEENDLVLVDLDADSRNPHTMLYRANSEIKSVFFGNPVYTAAFTLTNAQFDPRTIPESYIQLRSIEKVSLNDFSNTTQFACVLSETHPAMLIGNAGVITTGKTLTSAFDRLEVTEATAQSIINAGSIAEIVHIADAEIAEIDKTFGLL